MSISHQKGPITVTLGVKAFFPPASETACWFEFFSSKKPNNIKDTLWILITPNCHWRIKKEMFAKIRAQYFFSSSANSLEIRFLALYLFPWMYKIISRWKKCQQLLQKSFQDGAGENRCQQFPSCSSNKWDVDGFLQYLTTFNGLISKHSYTLCSYFIFYQVNSYRDSDI